MLGSVLDVWENTVSKTGKRPCLLELLLPWGEAVEEVTAREHLAQQIPTAAHSPSTEVAVVT